MRFDLEDWHSRHIPNWQVWLAPYKNVTSSALEIGSCEGRSALWLVDNILTGPCSDLLCVDPFSDEGFEGSDITHTGSKANQTYLNFCENVKPYTVNPEPHLYNGKVNLCLNTSHSALRGCYAESYQFDIIYIDGSHLCRDVLEDIVLAWPLLKQGGTLILDDYQWHSSTGKPLDEPRMAIDCFLAIYAREYELLGKGVQAAVRKR